MLGNRFYRPIKPKRFDYTARYYDPDEAKAKRRKEIFGEEESEAQAIKKRISKGFDRTAPSSFRTGRSEAVRKSNMRLFLIIGIIIAFFFWLMPFVDTAIMKWLG